jgi:hypothetical protein
MDSPTPEGINEQHVWGGTVFQYPESTSNLHFNQTLAAFSDPQDPEPALSPSSQAHLLASSSDDVFHPDSGGPTFVPYRLPPVPNNHAYNHIPLNREHLSQPPPRFFPYPSSYSSYNNPAFTYPQQHNSYTPSYQPLSYIPPPFYPQLEHHYEDTTMRPPPPLPPNKPFVPPVPLVSPAYMHLPNHNSQVPVQYIYCVPPSSLNPSTSSSVTKTLPSVSHISTLTNKFDFFAWDEGVTASLRANGLFGHIMDPSAPVDPTRPDITPAPLPILSANPSTAEINAFSRWWEEDNAAQHILVSKIGTIPRGLISPSNLVSRTALFHLPDTCSLLRHLQFLRLRSTLEFSP